MVPRVGQQIGPYEILGRLGSGGMGLVYSAWDARLQRDVAIKILREEYATPTMRSRFLQEARAASGLNHPNICTVFDIGEIANDPFLVMELLKGETLRACITRKGKLPPEDIHRIAAEVMDALSAAHSRGIIHRDIKPANIILVNKPDGSFQSKVLDFGLAKVDFGDEELARFDLTTIGTTVGTVSYMSPEQARGEPLDARSDLFSLGSVLYEAATGELPFQGATSALVFVELLGKAPAPIRQQNPEVPKDLERFIAKLLAKNPVDRFQSATGALEALKSVSLRASPIGNFSRWAKCVATQRAESANKTAPADREPYETRPPDSPGSPRVPGSGTVLRPARRAGDPGVRPHDPANSPSPGGTPRPSASPVPDPASPRPPARSSPVMGSVLVRPVKPDSLRPARMRETPAPKEPDVPATDAAPAEENILPTAPAPAGPALGSPDLNVPPGEVRDPFDTVLEDSAPEPLPAAIAYRRGAAVEKSSYKRTSAQRASSKGKKRPGARVLAVVLVLGCFSALFFWFFIAHRQAMAAKGPVTLVMAGVNNATADSSLPGIVTTGLEFAVSQSPHLLVRSAQAYALALRADGPLSGDAVSLDKARAAARLTGAGVLVFVDIRKDGAVYELALRLVNASNGQRIDGHTETASSREQIAQCLDRLGSYIRSTLEGSAHSSDGSALPLSREATSNVDALQSYANGAGLEFAGNAADAILAYQRSVSLDPHFTQAFLRLGVLYRSRHAETASASAATQAKAASSGASPPTQALAEAAYDIYAAGDYTQAADTLNTFLGSRGNDLRALDELALAQFLLGKFSDTQATLDHALQLFRYDPDATQLQELTLIAQGRPEAVDGVESRAKAAGLAHPGIAAMADAAGAAANETLVPSGETSLPTAVAANLLDASGHFIEGAVRWQAMGGYARSMPEQLSAAAYAESSAGLHRALAAECPAGLVAAHVAQGLPSGPSATFNAAEAQALCGELEPARSGLAVLNGIYAKNFAGQSYLVPDLAATIAWKSGDTAGALRLLDGARQFDNVSLTAYLRGLVELSSGQPQVSIGQFQAILSHRGPATLFAPESYPLAQLGLARAYAAAGDPANSSVAYARFLELWSSADTGLVAMNEARSHAHL